MANFNLHAIVNQAKEIEKLGYAEAARMLYEYKSLCVIFSEAQEQWKELARTLEVDGDNIDAMFSRAHVLMGIRAEYEDDWQRVVKLQQGMRRVLEDFENE